MLEVDAGHGLIITLGQTEASDEERADVAFLLLDEAHRRRSTTRRFSRFCRMTGATHGAIAELTDHFPTAALSWPVSLYRTHSLHSSPLGETDSRPSGASSGDNGCRDRYHIIQIVGA